MKRFLLFLPLLFVTLLSLIGSFSTAHAQPLKPHAFYNNYSQQDWPGNTQGGNSKFFMDNPGVSDGESWERYIMLCDNSACNSHFVQFGIRKCAGKTSCGPCAYKSVGGLWEFIYGDHIVYCVALPTQYINTEQSFSIFDATNNTTDMDFNNPDGSSMPCHGSCSAPQEGQHAWNHIFLFEGVDATFSNTHKVYGGTWTNNQWLQNHTQWTYQNTTGNGINQGNPPQMGWDAGTCLDYTCNFPAGSSNNGGIMGSCVYDPPNNPPDHPNECRWRA